MTREQFRRLLMEYANCATSASDRFKAKADEIRGQLEREVFGPETAADAMPPNVVKETTRKGTEV